MKYKNYHAILISLGSVLLIYVIWASIQPETFQLSAIQNKLIWSPLVGLSISYIVCVLFQHSDNEITKKGYLWAIISASILAPLIAFLVGSAIYDMLQQNSTLQGFKLIEGIVDKI